MAKSSYDPKFCDQIIKDMGEGYSFEAFCGRIGIARSTGYNWIDEFPDFKEAKSIAETKSQAFWEEAAKNGLTGFKGFNTGVWVFTMKNRFGWRDKQELVGADGGPIRFANLTPEQVDKSMEEILLRMQQSKLPMTNPTSNDESED